MLRSREETSYPYLWIATATGSDYGDVLSYADFLATTKPMTHWQGVAAGRLSEEVKNMVHDYATMGRL